jgi:predicted GNAT family N-acyltransferase
MDKIIVSIAHTQADFFRIIRLREEVFVLEQKVPLEIELDDEDERATHLIAREGREVVGTARLVVKGTAGKVGRMAVKRGWRKKGVGERLMETLLLLARERGVSSLVLHAQTSAVPFYQKQGFRTEGENFIEAGIRHVAMRRTV